MKSIGFGNIQSDSGIYLSYEMVDGGRMEINADHGCAMVRRFIPGMRQPITQAIANPGELHFSARQQKFLLDNTD